MCPPPPPSPLVPSCSRSTSAEGVRAGSQFSAQLLPPRSWRDSSPLLASILPVYLCPSGQRRSHQHTGCPSPKEADILYTASRFRVSPTVGSKPTFKINLNLKMCQKCSAQGQDLQRVAQAMGVKLTVHIPHWMQDESGPDLELLSDPPSPPQSGGLLPWPCHPTLHESASGTTSRRKPHCKLPEQNKDRKDKNKMLL